MERLFVRFSQFVGCLVLMSVLFGSSAASEPNGFSVTNVFPIGSESAPFDRMVIQFSKPISEATFTLSDVTVSGPGGAITPVGITKMTEDTYQLDLNGLTGLDTYVLVIGPNIIDSDGMAMDQNHNGTSGEGADSYTASLFGAGVTITDGNTTYENQNLIIYGNTATINGSHAYASVELLGNAILTHSPANGSNEYKIDLTITDGLFITNTARIDVSNRGYVIGMTAGLTTTNAAANRAGGSYGGLGRSDYIGAASNWTYGDYRNPSEPGSGGGPEFGTGGSGGGLIRINAGSIVNDGTIVANGGHGFGGGESAGSGGGIYLNVGTISGAGTISANGGNGYSNGGSGSGGRIAVYYGTPDFNIDSLTAHGGNGGTGPAAVGTVYLKQSGGEEYLRIISHEAPTGVWTPLGISADSSIIVDNLVISGTSVIVAPEHEMGITANRASVNGGGMLTHQSTTTGITYTLRMNITDTLTVGSGSAINVSNRGYVVGRTVGNSDSEAAANRAGGSYGGLGRSDYLGAASNWTYGDYRNPNEPGSGSGAGQGAGGSGGGLVRITAGNVIIDGTILANGGNGSGGGEGAGSGGGIYLSTDSLAGIGSITANGGNGYSNGGSGGGGRIAVYHNTLSGFNPDNITVHGGNGGTGPAAVGTVYLKDISGEGQLRVDSHGAATGVWTPLGMSSEGSFIVDHLVISGTNVVVAPEHEMPVEANKVTLLGGAMLTHQPDTASNTYSLQMSITNTLTISGTSKIDVSNRGYLVGRTTGNSTSGAAANRAGGSYGGLGRNDYINQASNWTYGDYRNPTEAGSGGGPEFGTGGSGGGLIRINAGSIVNDGSILANGGHGFGGGESAGSGGGIYLSAGTLSGFGTISANGGNGYSNGGSGSGGRIAVYYGTPGFNFDSLTAHGGNGGTGAAAVGTVYLKQSGGEEYLRIVSHEAPTGVWTPLGISADSSIIVDNLVISGTSVIVAPEHEMGITANRASVNGGGMLTHQSTTTGITYTLRMNITDTLTVGSGSAINVSNRGYVIGRTVGNSTSGAAANRAGGSYGGLGRSDYIGAASNWAYDDYQNPIEPGSGGGPEFGMGGSGGGLIRITVGSAVNDGSILANGGHGFGGGESAGSGGGIYLNVGTLSGSGTISANGGNGYSNGGSGGGGRIAVYHNTLSGFNPDNITVHGGNGGTGPAAVGTVYLKDISGEGQLRVASHGAATGVWTPLGMSSEGTFIVDHLVISGTNVVVAAEHEMELVANKVSLYGGAMLTHQPDTTTEAYTLQMQITDTLTVGMGSKIDVSNRGYLAGRTMGNSTAGAAGNRAGGSYGGTGRSDYLGVPSNVTYGDHRNPIESGSGGGVGMGAGGSGGGLIRINAGSVVIDGSILANGGSGIGGGESAGSGGGILLNSGTVSGAGAITANGGNGYSNGGSGGGGRIAIYTWTSLTLSGTNINANGGSGGVGVGQSGTVYSSTVPIYLISRPTADLIHGNQVLRPDSLGVNPSTTTVDVVAYRMGISTTVGLGLRPNRDVRWNTSGLSDGRYQLRAVFRNAQSQVVGEATRDVTINNSVIWHSGTILSNETWSAGNIHGVDGNLLIPSGITVTIAPSTTVKFVPETRVVAADGGTLYAPATPSSPIILTSITDDSAGGDTNLDGSETLPYPGEWFGPSTVGTGQLSLTANVDIRYVQSVHSGTLVGSETWLGTYMHRVTGDVVVPNGATLAIAPGAVVKFDAARSIVINPGGHLVASGTLAQPIIFTSIRDDSVGGDANNDGDGTLPLAGDWRWLHIDSADANLDHVEIRYGGSDGSGSWNQTGVIRKSGNASLLLANSVVRDSLFDGVLDWGGTAVISNTVFTNIDRAISAHPGSIVNVINCTVDGNGIGLLVHGGTLNVSNTIASNNDMSGIQFDFGTVGTVRYNNVWAPTGSGSVNYRSTTDQTGSNGNVSVDPKFKNRAQGNFRLDFGSPVIDAADGPTVPATDARGAPRYDDPRTANTGIATSGGAYADMGAFEFVETASSNVDLIVTSVNGPLAVTAGDSVTLTWTIANNGSEEAVGPWHDSVSLIGLQEVVAGDVLVGSGVRLGPGKTYQATGTFRAPGGVVGEYNWSVTANIRDEVFEGTNRGNNTGTSMAAVQLDLPQIPVGGSALSRRLAEVGQSHWFKIVPQAGQDVQVSLDLASTSGVTELYVSRGTMPTRQHFDVRYAEFNSADVTTLVPNTITDTYYVLAYAVSLPSGASNFNIQAQTRDFGLISVEPGTVGNSGQVTLELRGAKLRQDLTYQISKSGVSPRSAGSVRVVNSSLVYPSFNMDGLPTGTYDVIARTSGGLTVTLAGQLSVVAGTQPQFQVSIENRNAVRVNAQTPVVVSYRNTGNVDIKLPMITIKSSRGGDFRYIPDGVAKSGQLTFLATPVVQGLASLPPGSSGNVTVYFTAPGTSGDVQLSVYANSFDDPVLANRALDWNSISTTLRPAGYSDSQWSAFINAEKSRIGETYGSMFNFLTSQINDMGNHNASSATFVEGQWLFKLNPTLGPERPGADLELLLQEITSTSSSGISLGNNTPLTALSGSSSPTGQLRAMTDCSGPRKIRVLIIGDYDYKNAKQNDPKGKSWGNLPGCETDANQLGDLFKKTLNYPGAGELGPSQDTSVEVVVDKIGDGDNMGPNEVKDAIARTLDGAGPCDQVFIFNSGHGDLRTIDGQLTGAAIYNNGIMTASEFKTAFSGATSQVLLVMDTCHAAAITGEIDNSNVMIVSSTDYNQKARDGSSFTQYLVHEVLKNPTGNIWDAVDRAIYRVEAETLGNAQPGSPVREAIGAWRIGGTGRHGTLQEFLQHTSSEERQGYRHIQFGVTDKRGNNDFKFNRPDVKTPGTDQIGDYIALNPGNTVFRGSTIRVVQSVDPNEKDGPAGSGTSVFIRPGAALPYTVFFENDPRHATAPAQVVTVTDQLSSNLDWSTFELTEFAFGNQTLAIPAGLGNYATTAVISPELSLQFQASINYSTGVVTWAFRSIDPVTNDIPEDPLSGFLPPNNSSHIGEGHVSYKVRPKAGLGTGTVITNGASIIFDTNAPLATNIVTNTLDIAAPTSRVSMLSSTSYRRTFNVSWSGTDDTSGSGIAGYNIYYSVDGGAFAPWQIGTTQTTAAFTGEWGHSYNFYSVAVDHAGNQENLPGGAQASVSLPLDQLSPQVAASPANGATDVSVNASIVITFSEVIDTSTFAYNISPAVEGQRVTWNQGNTVATITHSPFARGRTYTVTITGSSDLVGNPVPGLPLSWSFTTEMYRNYLPLIFRNDN